MYAIDVIPLASSAPVGTLTYRSKKELLPGTLVEVLLRRTRVRALVISCVSVREIKSQLKRATFALSSSEPLSLGQISPLILSAVQAVAQYHASGLGPVLRTLLLEGVEIPLDAEILSGSGFLLTTLEHSTQERFASYREMSTASTASGKATLLVVPTIAELDYAKKFFQDLSPLVISGIMTRKRRAALLTQARTHTGLILTTPSFSWLPVASLGALVLERVSAGTYVLQRRPYLDMREAARALARARSVPLYFGDYPLPLEYREDPAQVLTEAPQRITVVDMRPKKGDDIKDPQPFAVIPPAVRAVMGEVLARGGRILVLAARKGYASTVVCRDCGSLVRDERGQTLGLTQDQGVSMLRTTDGTSSIETTRKSMCEVCGGWNLIPLGIGVERVEEELRGAFPEAEILRVSREQETTPKKMREALAEADKPGTILIGTEFILPWVAPESRFTLGVVASADSLLSLPFWRARERFIRIAFMLAERAERALVLTRRPDDAAVDALVHPATTEFFAQEAALRKAVSYPPFGTLISLSFEGSPGAATKVLHDLQARLGVYQPRTMQLKKTKGASVRASIVLMSTHWPDVELSTLLAQLPPSIRVAIDPESF